MPLILNQSDWDELCEQSPRPDNLALDEYEDLTILPELLGRGFRCDLELMPGIELSLMDWKYSRDWMFREPAHEHPIQTAICLAGSIYCDIAPSLDQTRSYFSGSGISPAYVEQCHKGQHLNLVDINLEPEVLGAFFGSNGQHSEPIQQLFKGKDYKASFYPKATVEMRSLARQMWTAPYRGGSRRLYLQAKVLELLVLQLEAIGINPDWQLRQPPKPSMVERIYYARDILLADLENPPSLPELAQQVEMSVCTLQRRFQEQFGMTVFGFLSDQRMVMAEQLLRQGSYTVAEVAATVGYANLSHFAAAFRRRFGITPRDCLAGKTLLLG